MLLVVTAIAALVPSLLLIWYFWARDVQREPGRVLWACFGLGVLSILPVLMVAAPLSRLIEQVPEPFTRGALEAFLTAAVPEEAGKLAVLLLYAERHKEFDEPMDGVVYGAAASIGFATLENVLYVSSGGLGVAAFRALTAVPGHAFLGAILGYYVGQAKFFPARRARLLVAGYAVAVLLHGLYDFPLLAQRNLDAAKSNLTVGPLLLVTLAALVFEAVWVVRMVRRLRGDQLHVVAVRAVMAGAAPPPGVLTAAPATSGAKIGGWIALLAGALLVMGGGLILLIFAFATLVSDASRTDLSSSVLVAVMFGAAPMVLGVGLFALGLKGLGPRAPLSPYARRAG